MKLSETELTKIMKPDTYLLYETRANAPSNTNIRFALGTTEERASRGGDENKNPVGAAGVQRG